MAPVEAEPRGALELAGGGGAGAPSPASASLPRYPQVPHEAQLSAGAGGGKGAEKVAEESDTNPTSRADRDAGGPPSRTPRSRFQRSGLTRRRRRRCSREGSRESEGGGFKNTLNEETLFGACRRDKQWPARGPGDIFRGRRRGQLRATRGPESEAGGRRKQAGTRTSQGPGSGSGRGGTSHVVLRSRERLTLRRGLEPCAPAQCRALAGSPVRIGTPLRGRRAAAAARPLVCGWATEARALRASLVSSGREVSALPCSPSSMVPHSPRLCCPPPESLRSRVSPGPRRSPACYGDLWST